MPLIYLLSNAASPFLPVSAAQSREVKRLSFGHSSHPSGERVTHVMPLICIQSVLISVFLEIQMSKRGATDFQLSGKQWKQTGIHHYAPEICSIS